MWKFHEFAATHILREINFGHFDTPKAAILTISAAVNLEFLATFDISKCDIFLKSNSKPPIIIINNKVFKTSVFDPLKSVKIDFT